MRDLMDRCRVRYVVDGSVWCSSDGVLGSQSVDSVDTSLVGDSRLHSCSIRQISPDGSRTLVTDKQQIELELGVEVPSVTVT